MLQEKKEEEGLKYENGQIYNLVNQIKKVEKEYLDGSRQQPVMLDDSLGEFPRQSLEERKKLFDALVQP